MHRKGSRSSMFQAIGTLLPFALAALGICWFTFPEAHILVLVGLVLVIASIGICAIMLRNMTIKNLISGQYTQAEDGLLGLISLRQWDGLDSQARALTLIAGTQLAGGKRSRAKQSLEKILERIAGMRKQTASISKDPTFSESLDQVLTSHIRDIEAVTELEYASILQQEGDFKKAQQHVVAAIAAFHEVRADLVRKMSKEEVARKKDCDYPRWLFLLKDLPTFERLSLIDKCQKDAYQLLTELQSGSL